MVSTPKPVKKAAPKPASPVKTGRVAAAKTGVATAGAAPKATTGGLAAVSKSSPRAVSASSDGAPSTQAAARQNANALRKKDLIDRVLAATGAKKKLVKEIVEATLTVLGDALSKGEMLNIPPFGKAKVSRPQDAGTSKAMTVKLRRTTAGGGGKANAKQSLADTEE